jgi:hypothetical protein
MPRHARAPRRSESLESYLWETRAVGLLALLVLAAAVVSDALGGHFWERHSLLAGLAGSFIVVMLSLAVLNEWLEVRQRRRWSVLAQHVMLELTRNARVVWTGVAELAGLMPAGARTASALDAGSRAVGDTQRLTPAVQELLADTERRRALHAGIISYVGESDELLGRWAAVMLNSGVYAEIVDRHVELSFDAAWLEALFDSNDPAFDDDRRGQTRNHPALQIEGHIDDQTLLNRSVAITQLAEELDKLTLRVALRIVPAEWWAERVGTSPSVWTGGSYAGSADAAAP